MTAVHARELVRLRCNELSARRQDERGKGGNLETHKGVPEDAESTLASVPKKGEIAQASQPGEALSEIAGLRYPIADHDILIGAMSPCRKYFIRGTEVDVSKIAQLPAWLFPIISREDLETKLHGRIKAATPVASSSPVLAPTHELVPASARSP
jgi:hypothetical protein